MKYIPLLLAITWLALLPGATTQAAPAPQAASAPTGATTVKVTVIKAQGPAQKSNDGGGQWQPLQAGDVLNELTVIRTGLGATVELAFEDRAWVTINNATKIGISELRRQENTVKTALGLKYGTLAANVEKTHGPNEFQVSTAVATLSVRGTAGKIGFSGDAGLNMIGTRGTWALASSPRRTTIAAGQRTDSRLTDPMTLAIRDRQPVIGDLFGGLNQNEILNQQINGQGRGIFNFDGGLSSSGTLSLPGASPLPQSTPPSNPSTPSTSDNPPSDNSLINPHGNSSHNYPLGYYYPPS